MIRPNTVADKHSGIKTESNRWNQSTPASPSEGFPEAQNVGILPGATVYRIRVIQFCVQMSPFFQVYCIQYKGLSNFLNCFNERISGPNPPMH